MRNSLTKIENLITGVIQIEAMPIFRNMEILLHNMTLLLQNGAVCKWDNNSCGLTQISAYYTSSEDVQL